MPSRVGALARATRSAVFAVAAVLLAGLAHTLGGGALPRPAVLAGTGAAVLALSALAAGRERSLPVIAVAMLALQEVLHTAFCLMSRQLPAVPRLSGIPLDRLWCAHGGGTGWQAVPAAAHPGSLAMVVLHVGAGLALAALLRGGERAVYGLRHLPGRVGHLVAHLLRAPAPLLLRLPRLVTAGSASRALHGQVLRSCLVLRGPPLAA